MDNREKMLAFASGLEELREVLRGMVNAVKQEGFTEEQAHQIVTAMFTASFSEAQREEGGSQ